MKVYKQDYTPRIARFTAEQNTPRGKVAAIAESRIDAITKCLKRVEVINYNVKYHANNRN